MAENRAEIKRGMIARWIIYGLIAVVVGLPFLFPAPAMQFAADPPTVKVFEAIEALKPGSHVLLAFDFDLASRPELDPMSRAVLKHCFMKGLIPVVMTFWPTGLDMDKTICEQIAKSASAELHRPLVSGKDWVFLGFRPAGGMLILQMGTDLKGAFDKDFFGQPTQSMPALSGVDSLRNIDLAVDFAAGGTVGMWIAMGSDKFGFPLAAGTTAVSTPGLYPFYQSKQIIGFMGGPAAAPPITKPSPRPGATRPAAWSHSRPPTC